MKYVHSGSSCTIVSPFVHRISWQKQNEKHPKQDIFSVLSIPVCRTSKTKIRISVSQLYPKLRIMHKKWRFHDTSARCSQCVPILFVRYRQSYVTLLGIICLRHESKNYGEKDGFCVICVSLQRGPRTKMGCSMIQLRVKSHNIHK